MLKLPKVLAERGRAKPALLTPAGRRQMIHFTLRSDQEVD